MREGIIECKRCGTEPYLDSTSFRQLQTDEIHGERRGPDPSLQQLAHHLEGLRLGPTLDIKHRKQMRQG